MTTGSVARLAIGFVASVLIARTLGPSTLGIYATLAALGATVGAFTDFGLTESAVKRIAFNWPDNRVAAEDSARAYVWLRTALTTGVVIVFLALLPLGTISRVLPGGPKFVSLVLLGTVATGLGGTFSGLLQATGRFGRLSIVMMANAALTTTLAVVLRMAGILTLTTALIVLGIGTSLACCGIGWYLIRDVFRIGPPTWEVFRSEGGHLLRFGRWLWLANTLAMLAAQLDLFLAGHWLSPAAVGAYALAVSLASKVGVANQSLHAVLLPIASSLRSRDMVLTYLRRGVIRSVMIALLLLPVIPLSGLLIPLVFGAEYGQSIGLFVALLGVGIVDLIFAPVLLLPYTADRPAVLTAADAVRVVALLIAAVLLVPSIGAFGLVMARLLASVAGLILTVAVLAHQSRSKGRFIQPWFSDEGATIQVE